MTYQRLLRWVSMSTAFFACIWFSPSLLDPFNIPKLAILVVGAAALLGLLLGGVKQWFKRGEWPVWGSVALFIMGLTAAGLASDQASYRTLFGAWARNDGWLAYAALALITLSTALAFRDRDARFGVYTLIAAGYVQVAYSLLQTTGNDPVNWNNGYNPILGTVGNPNFASALMGVTAVAMCWVALEKTINVWTRITNAVIALIAVWLTIRSDSIQGTMAFAAGFAVLLAAWLSEMQRSAGIRKLFWPYIGVGALGTGLGIWGLTGSGPLGSILYSQTLVNRTYYWRAGWNMFKRDPLFGIGLDSFGDYYRLLRVPEQVAVTGAQTVSNAAHSVVFQFLGTGGIALFGTYLALQVVAVARGVVALRGGGNRLLVGALLGTWAAFSLQSLFSIDQLGLTVWGWVISGLLLGVSYAPAASVAKSAAKKRSRQRSAAATPSAFIPAGAGALLAMVGIATVASPLSVESQIRVAVSYAYDTQKPDAAAQGAIRSAVLAAAGDSQDPYWRATAINKLFQIGAVDDGLRFAEESAKQFPMDVTLWHLVATAYEQTGRAAQATSWRERTVELDPLNDEYAKLLRQDKAAN